MQPALNKFLSDRFRAGKERAGASGIERTARGRTGIYKFAAMSEAEVL